MNNLVNVKVGGVQDVIRALQNYNTIILKPNIVDNRNVLTQEMMSERHTKYIIRWNYSLEGATINVPEDCIIEFAGGTIDNGTIVGNNTMLMYSKPIDEVFPAERQGTFVYNTTVADEEDITSESGQLKFKDRPATDGMGKKILRKNIVNGVNTLTQSMMQATNTIYIIQYDFVLGEDITVPANCVLEFDGGSLSNGSLVLQNTLFDGVVKFGGDLEISGTCANSQLTPNMFGAKGDGVTDDTAAFVNIERLTDYTRDTTVYIPAGHYIVRKSLHFKGNVHLYGDGNSSFIDMRDGDVEDYAYFRVGGKLNNYTSEYATILPQSSGNISEGDISIEFAENVSLNKNDIISIVDTTPYSWSAEREYYVKGEFVQVSDDTNAAIVNIKSPIYDNYTLSNNLLFTKINMYHVHIHDLQFKFEYVLDMVGLSCCRAINSKIDNVTIVDGVNNSNIQFIQSYNSTITSCRTCFPTPLSGNNYGIGVANSQIITISNCVCKTSRHGITVGGAGASRASIVCREVHITNCICGALSNEAQPSIDTHTNTDLCIISNCVAYGGIDSSGKRNSVINNVIHIGLNFGAVRCVNIIDSIVVSGNMIWQDYASQDIFGFNTSVADSNIRRITISNNTIYRKYNPSNSQKTAQIVCCLGNSNIAHNELFFINNNIVYTEYVPIENQDKAIFISDGYDKLVIENNNFEAIGQLYLSNFQELRLKDNFVTIKGINTSYIRNASGSLSKSYIAGNKFICQGIIRFEYLTDAFFTNNDLPSGGYVRFRNCNGITLENNTGYLPNIEEGCTNVKAIGNNLLNNILAKTNPAFVGQSIFGQSFPKKLAAWDGERWVNSDGFSDVRTKGNTSQRPIGKHDEGGTTVGDLTSSDIGFRYYDTNINKLIYAKSINNETGVVTWIESDLATAGVTRSGVFANKPDAADIYVGFKYFCTDKQTIEGATNGIEIIHKGNNVWVDALGRVVS